MKKIAMILAATVLGGLALTLNTGCDADLEFGDVEANGRMMVIDRIPVEPGEWKAARLEDGSFDYYYADKDLLELNEYVFNRGTFQTFFKYEEERGGHLVDVQESLPVVINLDRFENGEWFLYTETISCSYEVGYVRFMISRSDFSESRPKETLLFRTVVSY